MITIRSCLGFACAAALILGCSPTARAQADTAREAALKAAFLYNFAKFTDWGSRWFRGAADPIVFCVGTNSPLRDAAAALQGKPVGTHPVRVMAIAGGSDLGACHVLFVDASLTATVRQRAATLAGVLTVSDLPDFARSGGDIGLYYENDRLRFEINVGTARRAGITFSSRLLQLATVIGRESSWPPVIPVDIFAEFAAGWLDRSV